MWEKNYRVKSQRKYIYFYIVIFFFSRTWSHKRVKYSLVFCKAYIEPLIGHNSWHFINLKNIHLSWMGPTQLLHYIFAISQSFLPWKASVCKFFRPMYKEIRQDQYNALTRLNVPLFYCYRRYHLCFGHSRVLKTKSVIRITP